MTAEWRRDFTILVVDDERDIRDGSERILTRMGHRVLLAERGEEALYILKETPADVVLLDLKMPGLDGLEVLDRIRRAHPDILVIIVTGFATIETAIEAMKKGAYDFMTKPFRPDQLRIVAGRAVEHIRLLEERDRLSEERERGLWAITTEKSRLRTVIDSILAGLLIMERDRRIVMSNPAFHHMTGINSGGLTGSYVADHPELSTVDGMIDEVLKGRTDESGGVTSEFVIERERPAHIRASVNAVSTETGKVLGLVAVFRDITRQKEEEREKSAFVAMLTHELRSPLGAVDTQFAAVLKGLAGDLSEKQKDMLGRMRGRVHNVLEMVNSLLDLSKIEAGQFVQEKTPLDINPIVADCVDMFRAQAQESGLSLEMDLSPALPRLSGDPGSLKEVAANLISNALRYTPQGGQVRVSTGLDGDNILFTVSDTGVGIAPENQAKIFERFFRVKDEKTRHVMGTGLGLPIVRAIVENHQGKVSVESRRGEGARFIVRLPVLKGQ